MVPIPNWPQWNKETASRFARVVEPHESWHNQYAFYYQRVQENEVIFAQYAAMQEQLEQFKAEGEKLLEVLPALLHRCGLSYTRKYEQYGTPEEDRVTYCQIEGFTFDEFGLYYKINTLALPHKVTKDSFFPKNNDPDIPGTLEMNLKHNFFTACSVKVELDQTRPGLWIVIELVDRGSLIPKHVPFKTVYDLLPGNNPLEISIGLGAGKQFFHVDMDDPTSAHMLVGGVTGGGKSVFLNQLMSCVILNSKKMGPNAKPTRLIGVDLKMGIELAPYQGLSWLGGDVRFILGKDDDQMEFEDEILAAINAETEKKRNSKKIINPIRTIPSNYKPKGNEVINPPLFSGKIISEPRLVKLLLLYVLSEIKRRGNLFKDTGVRNIAAYNRKFPNDQLSRWLIVFDEVAQMMNLGNEQKECLDLLGLILGVARVLGIHVVLCTQNPKAEILTDLIKGNTPITIAFYCATTYQSISLLGDGEATKLSGHPGEAIFETPAQRVRVQTPFQSDYLNKQIIRDSEKKENTLQKFGALDPGEIWEYALNSLGGYCTFRDLVNRFGHERLMEKVLQRSEVQMVNGQPDPVITIKDDEFVLIPGKSNAPRRLIKVEEFLATCVVNRQEDNPLGAGTDSGIETESATAEGDKTLITAKVGDEDIIKANEEKKRVIEEEKRLKREKISKMLLENPGLSNRKLAETLGISLGVQFNTMVKEIRQNLNLVGAN